MVIVVIRKVRFSSKNEKVKKLLNTTIMLGGF